jgi:hypothetical protein
LITVYNRLVIHFCGVACLVVLFELMYWNFPIKCYALLRHSYLWLDGNGRAWIVG